MAERQIGHRKSSLVLSARFPVVKWRSRPVAKSAYFWTGNFFFPDTASVDTYPVHPVYESPLQNGKCLNSLWIRNRVDAKSVFFFIRWRNKVESSSLPWIMYSRWKHRSQVLSRQSKMQISRSLRRMLSCQYSQRCPGYKSEPGYVWTGKFDLSVRVWTWKFLNPDRKSCGFNIPDTCGRGLKQESMYGLWAKKGGRFRKVAVSGGLTVLPLNWTPSENLKRKISF